MPNIDSRTIDDVDDPWNYELFFVVQRENVTTFIQTNELETLQNLKVKIGNVFAKNADDFKIYSLSPKAKLLDNKPVDLTRKLKDLGLTHDLSPSINPMRLTITYKLENETGKKQKRPIYEAINLTPYSDEMQTEFAEEKTAENDQHEDSSEDQQQS